MEMIFSAIAVMASLGSLTVAILAFRRSGRANAAENEFKDVKWEVLLSPAGARQVKLTLKNTGTTAAKEVRLEASRVSEGSNSYFTFPVSAASHIAAGGTHEVLSYEALGSVAIHDMYELFEDPYFSWSVTWKSPLGTLEEYRHDGIQVF